MFLTLTGLIIFAMLGTMVETARYTACKNHAARTLRTSVEGLMTEYSRPLYDNYGLFFLESSGPAYEKVIAGYVGDTFEAAERGDMDFLAGQTDSVEVVERTGMGDDGAEALQEEINAYMLRHLTKKQLSKFLGKSEKIYETETQAQEMETLVEEEKKLGALDQQVLELMKLIDGITVRSGKVTCQKEFVKMFAVSGLQGVKYGVTNAKVWKAMKAKLDKTPGNWEKLEQSSFPSHVQSVLKLTEQAVEKAEKLKNDYTAVAAGGSGEFAEHRQWLGQFIDSLSVLQGNAAILSETVALLSGEVTEETEAELTELWKDYNVSDIVFDYSGIDVSSDAESPMEALSGAMGDGILNLVCEKPESLSGCEVKNPDNTAEYYGEEAKGTDDCSQRVRDFTEKEEVRFSGIVSAAEYAMDEFCLDSYIQEKFRNYTDQGKTKWKTALQYQWEYVLAGKKKDRRNLESVLNRILLIRTVVNFAAIYRDSGKKSSAYAAAAALVGFTGMEPLIRLAQTLILIAWSMVEGLVDVAGILQGRDIPLIKSPSQIRTAFGELFQISGPAITERAKSWKKGKESSFGYADYVKVFLAVQKPGLRRYRIMDLIQWDMEENGYTGFQPGTCVFSMRVKGTFTFPSRLFRMAPLEAALGRDIRSYPAVCEISASYL